MAVFDTNIVKRPVQPLQKWICDIFGPSLTKCLLEIIYPFVFFKCQPYTEILVGILNSKYAVSMSMFCDWNVYICAQDLSISLKILSRLYLPFILTPRSINTSEELPATVTAAHTITMGGFWVVVAYWKFRFLGNLSSK